MLIYKLNKEIKNQKDLEIQYNQRTITIAPGESLDVRDFRVPSSSIKGVERHLLFKYPSVFDQEETKDIMQSNKEYLEKIDILEKQAEESVKNTSNLEQGCKRAENKLNKVLTEMEGLKNMNKSLCAENGELRAKVKALS